MINVTQEELIKTFEKYMKMKQRNLEANQRYSMTFWTGLRPFSIIDVWITGCVTCVKYCPTFLKEFIEIYFPRNFSKNLQNLGNIFSIKSSEKRGNIWHKWHRVLLWNVQWLFLKTCLDNSVNKSGCVTKVFYLTL